MTQRINQQGEQDCYLCCLCMALGISYEEMTSKLGAETVQRIQRTGTYNEDIALVYRLLDLKKGIDYKTFYRHDIKTGYGSSAEFARDVLWGRRALVQVNSLNNEGGQHLIYWDGFELLDPSNKKTYIWDIVQPLYITIFNERKR